RVLFRSLTDVSRTYPPPCRSDGIFTALLLFYFIKQLVIRQNNVGSTAYFKAFPKVAGPITDLFNLFKQCVRIYNHSITDNTGSGAVKDARRNKMQHYFLIIKLQGQ